MKSDEEFIAGIYAKAKAYDIEHIKQEDDNVIHISSFQQKIKRISKYTAGVAACFACGIAVYLGSNIEEKNNDNIRILQGRKSQQNEKIQPLTIESNLEQNGIINKQDGGTQYLHCVVEGISVQDGIDYIDVVADDGEHVTLLVPAENKSKLIEIGNEVVLSVSEQDSLGNYTIAIDQEVYLYSGMEKGEKVFTSENHAVLKESNLKAAE